MSSSPSTPSASPEPAQEAPVRKSPHERLSALGLRAIGRANDCADEIYALMAKTPLFADLDLAQTQTLGGFMYIYEAPAGITLITEGEAGDFMVLLMHGSVEVLRRNRQNVPARIAVAQPGHALGEMSMFDGEPRFASCVTTEPCRIAVLTRDAMMLVMQDDPRLGSKILLQMVRLLSDRLRTTSAKLVTLIEVARQGG